MQTVIKRVELRPEGRIVSAVFSPKAERFLLAFFDGAAEERSAETGELIRNVDLTHGPYALRSAVYSPDGERILTGHGDGTAKVWNATEVVARTAFSTHKYAVKSAVFSPDGKRVLTASAESTAKVWNADTGEFIASLYGHTASVNSVVFLPDGHRALTASDDGTAKLWDAVTGQLLATLVVQVGPLLAAASDGNLVVAWSSDGTGKFFQLSMLRGLGS